MYVVFVLACAAVLLAVALAADGRLGAMADAPPDLAPTGLPDGPLDADALARLRFGVGLRGYRMDQVDRVLVRVGDELDERDARIARLQSDLVAARSAGGGEVAPPADDDVPPRWPTTRETPDETEDQEQAPSRGQTPVQTQAHVGEERS